MDCGHQAVSGPSWSPYSLEKIVALVERVDGNKNGGALRDDQRLVIPEGTTEIPDHAYTERTELQE